VEEEGEADRGAAILGNQGLGHPPVAEEALRIRGLVRDHVVGQPLVLGEVADQLEDDAGVLDGGETQRHARHMGRFGARHRRLLPRHFLKKR